MLTVQDCLRNAFAALLRNDLAERDRWCAMAQSVMTLQDRVAAGQPPVDDPIRLKPALPPVIYLPDRSEES